MKRTLLLYLLFTAIFFSCKKEGCTDELAENFNPVAKKDDGSCLLSTNLGELTVNMTAKKGVIRSQESLLGNFTADALFRYALNNEETIDFAMINGGNLRFNSDTRPDGIYLAGDWSSSMVSEILPFGNNMMIVTVTGEELKSICERSVADLPDFGGQFLHFSSQVVIEIDTSMSGQTIDDINEPTTIVSNGSRIHSIKINGVEYDPIKNYKIIAPSYIAIGNDEFVALANISSSNRKDLGELMTASVEQYLINYSPLTPEIEGRIIFL